MVYLRERNEIEAIRAAAQLVARTLDMLALHVRPGVTTAELDRLAEAFIREHGARPAFKGYRGFPATICPSVNAEVVATSSVSTSASRRTVTTAMRPAPSRSDRSTSVRRGC